MELFLHFTKISLREYSIRKTILLCYSLRLNHFDPMDPFQATKLVTLTSNKSHIVYTPFTSFHFLISWYSSKLTSKLCIGEYISSLHPCSSNSKTWIHFYFAFFDCNNEKIYVTSLPSLYYLIGLFWVQKYLVLSYCNFWYFLGAIWLIFNMQDQVLVSTPLPSAQRILWPFFSSTKQIV